jgi:cytochrome c oxidase subunit 2
LGCAGCHEGAAGEAAPSLVGIYGAEVALEGGGTLIVDDDYLRRSILAPRAEIVSGYPPIMPEFGGRLTDEELTALIEYVRSLTE